MSKTTTLKAQTKRLRSVFTLLTLSKTNNPVFNPIVIEIVDQDKEPYIQMQATNSANTVITNQKHRNIEIHQDEGSDPRIPINGLDILNALKLFDDETEVEIEFGQDNIKVRDTENVKIKDEVKLPMIDLESIESYDETPPFAIDKKGVIEIKNKKTEKFLMLDVTSTIPTEFIKAQIKRADFANLSPRLFQLEFQKNELKLIVGDDSDAYAKSVTSTVDVEAKGKGTCVYGDGYEEIFGSLEGSVIFMASEKSPAWITQKEDDHIVQFLLAPAIIKED